jgi:hypothetical protein
MGDFAYFFGETKKRNNLVDRAKAFFPRRRSMAGDA